uniref:Peptidase S8 pro-domain domain-containing protein n=1 Tax=Anopheles culicifacies TaxID=139723 RepID=A0A182M4Y5_9DIPT
MAPPAQRSCIGRAVHHRRSHQPAHSPYPAMPPPDPHASGGGRAMPSRWLYVALAALLAITLHEVDASPNATTIANGSGDGLGYNVTGDDLITPDEINAGLLEYAAGPLPLAAMEAAKPKRANARPAAIYMNEFAVYIPRGVDVADSIAHKYGFSNLGQVGKGQRNGDQCAAWQENDHATMMRM